jgi:hypothetical protein
VAIDARLGTPKFGETRTVAVGAHADRILRDHIASERKRHFQAHRVRGCFVLPTALLSGLVFRF